MRRARLAAQVLSATAVPATGAGFRWHGDLTPIDGLARTGLWRTNDESWRWSMPLTIGAVVRF